MQNTGNLQTAQIYTSNVGLNQLKLKAKQQSPEAIKAVAKQFEGLFLQMMLKSMRATSFGDGLFDNDQSKMYQDLFDKQIALKLSQKGEFGMSQIIGQQLKKFVATQTGKTPVSVPGIKASIKTAITPGTNTTLPANADISKLATDIKNIIKQQVDKLMKSVTTNSAEASANVSGTYKTPAEFVKSVWLDVKEVAKKLGVSPKAVLAQTILETGWGKHVAKNKDGSSSHNLFGIKSGSFWAGKSVNARTLEFSKGTEQVKTETFRSYPTTKHSITDYANLLKTNPRYHGVLKNGSSVAGFAKAMQESGYATDPEYGAKIMRIVNSPKFQDVMKDLVM